MFFNLLRIWESSREKKDKKNDFPSFLLLGMRKERIKKFKKNSMQKDNRRNEQ
jgi:hypothetical protein